MTIKVVKSKYDENRKCFTEEGELLIAASPKSKSKVRLRKSDHFFVGLNTGNVALYGCVAEVSDNISIEQLMDIVKKSPARKIVGESDNEILSQIKLTINSLKNIKPGSTVVCGFRDKSFMDKTSIQVVYKVFLRGEK